MWIANLLALCALAPDSLPLPTPGGASLAAPSDTARVSRPPLPSGTGGRPAPNSSAAAPYQAPDWSWEIAPRAGVVAVDFPQRSHFASELSARTTRDSLAVRQPFPGSDLAWTAGLDLVLRHGGSLRFVAGLGWTGWSAQAIAGRSDSLLRALKGDSLVHQSYSSDLWTAEAGFDLLIPRRILSVDAARDAFVGVRLRAGRGVLEGSTRASGLCVGETFLLGADVATWRRWAVSGSLAWSSISTSTSTPWSRMLPISGGSDRIAWNAGGLSLQFQLRWGPDRDSSGLGPSAQRK